MKYTSMKESVKCSTCFRFRDHHRILSCTHSLCEECLSSLDINENNTWTCPICTKETKVPENDIQGLNIDIIKHKFYHQLKESQYLLVYLFQKRPNMTNYWIMNNGNIIFLDDGELFIKFPWGDCVQSLDKVDISHKTVAATYH